jgi:hypothetical protein
MPAAAVAGGVALAGLAGQYFAAQAQKEAAAKGASAQVQAQAMAIGAQRDAEERAREYYEPFRQLGVRAATPISDTNYARMTGREVIGQDGWRVNSSGTPYRNAATEQQNAMLRNTAVGNFSGGFGGGGFGGGGLGNQRALANSSQPDTVYQNPSLNSQSRRPVTNALTSFLNTRGGFSGQSGASYSFGGGSARGGNNPPRIGNGNLGGSLTGARTLARRR